MNSASWVEEARARIRSLPSESLRHIRDYASALGPGLVTGASDDDPSCLGTLAQTGAAFGYGQLWVAPLAFPLMGIVQEICARVGLQTGHGLAQNIREHFPKPVLYLAVALVFLANTITLGADLGAMAASARLLLGIPFIVWLFAIPLVCSALQIFSSYGRYVVVLRLLALSLLAYVLVAFITPENWGAVLQNTIVPKLQFTRAYWMNLVALFGSTISPYLYFWQISQEIERKIAEGSSRKQILRGVVMRVADQGAPKRNVQRMRLDVISGMLFSGLVAWSVMVTTATTLNPRGIVNLDSAATAAQALQPLAGRFAYALFAAGILGVGMLALPILAGAVAYAIAEMLDLPEGLSLKLRQAPGFYGAIVLAMFVGIGMNLLGINPIQALYYAGVINGIAAPLLLAIIMRLASDRAVMREHANGLGSNLLGWGTTALMSLAGLALLATTVLGR